MFLVVYNDTVYYTTPEWHKCCLLIEKLLHVKPEDFPILKELQASIPQTKQPPLSEPDPKLPRVIEYTDCASAEG